MKNNKANIVIKNAGSNMVITSTSCPPIDDPKHKVKISITIKTPPDQNIDFLIVRVFLSGSSFEIDIVVLETFLKT